MTKYDVRVVWVPSVSDDVVRQELVWTVNPGEGEIVKKVDLLPSVSERLFSQDFQEVVLGEGDVVKVGLRPFDSYSGGDVVEGSVQVPIEPPEAVTGLTVELVPIVEEPTV